MSTRTMKIWIWVYNDKLMKAIFCPEEGTLTICDENDNIILKRTGLTPAQIKKIEITIASAERKDINGHKEPFTYL